MATWMDRNTSSLIQMGGEGVNWVDAQPLQRQRGTCSRTLATAPTITLGPWRSARRLRPSTNITYKILFNGAVAMTGGQPVDGPLSVETIAEAQVRAEGVERIAVVSDQPENRLEIRRISPPV